MKTEKSYNDYKGEFLYLQGLIEAYNQIINCDIGTPESVEQHINVLRKEILKDSEKNTNK